MKFRKICTAFLFCLSAHVALSQLPVGRDTITVIENGYVLKMPWVNGINHSNVSNIDLNFDGKKDIVVFDRINYFGVGRFRCFLKEGNSGQVKYRADPGLSYFFPQISHWAVFLDYNCDGKEDLFAATTGGVKVYKNMSGVSSGINFTLVKSLLVSDFTGAGGMINDPLYVSTIGVPGISDIDNDGDLDILTFSAQGVLVEYHQNMSKETFGNCDSLVFKLSTGCWGHIIETGCAINLNQNCAFKPGLSSGSDNTNSLHAGSCLTCLDGDGDGDKDLVMGDVACNVMQYAYNTGSPSNANITDSTKLFPNYPNKNNTTQIRINNFPCVYNVDVDGDSKNDLVAAPNSPISENTQGLWYYKNTSLTNTVNFQFVKKNLFQEDMIEVGQNSYPILFDYNADGKKDLLIGTFGYYSGISSKSQLTLYENIGTLSQPSYSLITRDYANISTQNINCVMPTVGDIDGDGDIDILVGTSNGKIHWLQNSAGAGNICNFSVFLNNPFNFTTQYASAAPQLFDIDKDGKLDLMIGSKIGSIAYYRNVGSTTVPSFSLMTNFFGNVDVKGLSSLYAIDGYATPHFFDESGITKLLVGSVSGDVFYYNVPSSTANCILLGTSVNGYNEGGQSTVFFEDINNDNVRDLFVGNASGGLSYFSSTNSLVAVSEIVRDLSSLKLFPNPVNDILTISLESSGAGLAILQVEDVLGHTLFSEEINASFQEINVASLKAGIYFVRINLKGRSETKFVKKIIKL